MIMRGLFAASLALPLCGAGLTGLASAFDWHRPAPTPRRYDPARPEPPVLHPDAPDAKMPDWAEEWLEQQPS